MTGSDLDLVGEPLWVLPGVGVDPSRKGVQVGAEVRALCRVPLAGAARVPMVRSNRSDSDSALAPILGRPSSGLAVEAQEKVAVGVHLRPAKGEEEIDGVIGEDVRHSPGVPEEFGAAGTRGANRRSVLGDGVSICQRGGPEQRRPANSRAPHRVAPLARRRMDLG